MYGALIMEVYRSFNLTPFSVQNLLRRNSPMILLFAIRSFVRGLYGFSISTTHLFYYTALTGSLLLHILIQVVSQYIRMPAIMHFAKYLNHCKSKFDCQMVFEITVMSSYSFFKR